MSSVNINEPTDWRCVLILVCFTGTILHCQPLVLFCVVGRVAMGKNGTCIFEWNSRCIFSFVVVKSRFNHATTFATCYCIPLFFMPTPRPSIHLNFFQIAPVRLSTHSPNSPPNNGRFPIPQRHCKPHQSQRSTETSMVLPNVWQTMPRRKRIQMPPHLRITQAPNGDFWSESPSHHPGIQ